MKLEAGKTYVDVSGNLWGDWNGSSLLIKKSTSGIGEGCRLLFNVDGSRPIYCLNTPNYNISHEYVEPETEPKTTTLKLEVGERYFTRDGRLSDRVLHANHLTLMGKFSTYIGEHHYIFEKDGCLVTGSMTNLDLVRKAVRGVDYNVKGKNNNPNKKSILDLAKQAVGDRGLNYGKPEDNFDRIANLWNAYLLNKQDKALYAEDVACMMILLKVARLQNFPHHKDSIVDVAGYAECLGEMINED